MAPQPRCVGNVNQPYNLGRVFHKTHKGQLVQLELSVPLVTANSTEGHNPEPVAMWFHNTTCSGGALTSHLDS